MMDPLLLLLLGLSSGSVQTSVIQREKWYNFWPLTWSSARSHCQRVHSGDLLTVVTQEDLNQVNLNWYFAWFGLHRSSTDGLLNVLGSSGWEWADCSGNRYLFYSEPKNGEDCALVLHNGDRTYSSWCGSPHFSFCRSSSGDFSFVSETRTWVDARDHCRAAHQDLATFDTWKDSPADLKRDFPVWTGLYHDGESWRWSDGELSEYRNWTPESEPGPSPGPGLCGSVGSQTKSMSVQNCSQSFPFLCYRHNLVLVQDLLTWEQALDRCTTLQGPGPSPNSSFQLLSVEESELQYALSQASGASTNKVWLGLRFLSGSWFWSNGANVSLSSLPSCPESRLHCGALVRTSTGSGPASGPGIEPSDCSQRLNLLCYGL